MFRKISLLCTITIELVFHMFYNNFETLMQKGYCKSIKLLQHYLASMYQTNCKLLGVRILFFMLHKACFSEFFNFLFFRPGLLHHFNP